MKTLTDASEFIRARGKFDVRWSEQNHLLSSLSCKIFVVEVDFEKNSFGTVQSELDQVTLSIQLKVNVGKSATNFSGTIRHQNTIQSLETNDEKIRY
jgi:hypothetical protein